MGAYAERLQDLRPRQRFLNEIQAIALELDEKMPGSGFFDSALLRDHPACEVSVARQARLLCSRPASCRRGCEAGSEATAAQEQRVPSRRRSHA